MNSLFELTMLVCFGLSWPFSVYRSWKSGSTRGKSLVFLLAVWLGYVSGILHKCFYALDAVIFVYILNLAMVSLDLALFFRNRHLEEALGSERKPV
jgi:hypothetical protein